MKVKLQYNSKEKNTIKFDICTAYSISVSISYVFYVLRIHISAVPN